MKAQKQLISRIIPDLGEIAGKNRERISGAEIFVGERGLRTAMKYYSVVHLEVKYYVIFISMTAIMKLLVYSRLYQFQKSKGLEERGISSIKFKQSKHYKEIPKDVNLRFVSFPLPGTIDIIKNNLLIITWANVTGILVTSKKIAEHFKNYFDSIWNMAS